MKINVLDHGYVELIETWGHGKAGEPGIMRNELTDDCEVGIIEAARQSTQKGFLGWDQDAKLLKYLHDHKHATPFEFAGMVIEVQAPIFVFREWHRHRTQSYNEMSARYAPLPDMYYHPDPQNVAERIEAAHASKNKQDQASAPAVVNCKAWVRNVQEVYAVCEEAYQASLVAGVPKELARITMPVGHYSRMRASANLRNWLSFLTLRQDPAAQWEIRQFANAIGECIATCFPQTWALLNKEKP